MRRPRGGYGRRTSDPNTDRERLADEALGRDPDSDSDEPNTGEPWAKTSSGDKEHVASDDDDN